MTQRIAQLFATLDATPSLEAAGGLTVTTPADGSVLAQLKTDDASAIDTKIKAAVSAQKKWSALPRAGRAQLIEAYSGALSAQNETLAQFIHLEAGKTPKESLGEINSGADVLRKTIKDATLPEFSGMLRTKERPPVGMVGLITSFNFPMVVAQWTLAPALLAGNAVVWKPSEKTPLAALACKAVFDQVFGEYKDLLQVIIGLRETGEALVAHEQVDLISATGSVAMGEGIKRALAKKKNNNVAPILELGGNNGVILSGTLSQEHLEFAAKSLLNSFLGTTGQRCTNTRRLIVDARIYAPLAGILTGLIETFLTATISGNSFDAGNEYGYGALIDEDAFTRFEQAKNAVLKEGGTLQLGKRLWANEIPHGYYVQPALALLPAQSPIMHKETFAPLLFMVPYSGDIDEAIALVNAPDNAGLVGGIYTQSQKEADRFASRNEAGHSVINSPKGTGTPAFGMGFGGNKASGTGEILNAADPLQAFTRPGKFSRIAQYKDLPMDAD